LKQGQYSPMKVTDQIISIFAGTQGFFDSVPVEKTREAERVTLQALHESHRDLWNAINDAKVIDGANEQKLRSVLKDVVAAFLTGKSYDPR
jgi:F-type H+/Na+-transporting ATPase subunit alpha